MIKQLMDTAVRHSRFFLARTAINFSSAMEHRVNFVIQILGGIALEMGFFFVWVMLFTSYPVINGWTMNDSALLLSVGWGAMDLVLFLTYGILDISALVGDGKLDQYLLYPIHPLVTIAAGKVRPLSLGTIVTIGFMLSWCGCTAAVQLLRFVLMVLLGALIYASFLVIIQSLSFFIGPSKRFANAIMFGVINLLYIPPTVCTGGLLLLTKTVMPIFFIAVLPMQLGKHFSRSEPVDMMISLHACDTATDHALAQAIAWKAQVILAVPCCHKEVLQQIKHDDLQPLLAYGIIKERTAALFTDALRAELLQTVGYKVQLLEFIDLEHTPKNILIRALKSDKPVQHDVKLQRCLTALHLKTTLQRLLADQ